MAVDPGKGDTGGGERDRRLDLLYRDAARETPPPQLDAAILAAARREVGARPRPLSALRRWRVPVSIAAVVVLSVSLVTLVREEGGEALLREERVPAAPAIPPAAESARQPAEAAKAPEAGARLAAKPDARKRAVPAPDELSLRRDEVPAMAKAELGRAVEREQARPSGEPEPQAGPVPAPAPPAAVSGALSYQLRDAPARAEADAAQRVAPRGAAADSAPAAPSQPQSKPQIGTQRYMKQAPATAAEKLPAWHGLEQEPPQRWIERLTELKKQGRTHEAEELLAEIKRRFPDQLLPGGLE
jgi:hypothetical protein